MFIKPFKIKSNVQIKASDKRKFRAKLVSTYKTITENDLNKLMPSKANIAQVKLFTHNGDGIIVYVVDKRPMFFETQDNKLFPTLYTLWLMPDLLPIFTTHPDVLPKMANGADLMLPGVIKQGQGMYAWGRYNKDEIVTVNLTSNRAAVCVGTLARSSEDLYMSGGTGICIKIWHVFGDKLWSFEPSVCQQVPIMNAIIHVPKSSDFPPLGSDPKFSNKIINDENIVETIIAPIDTLTIEQPVLDNKESDTEVNVINDNSNEVLASTALMDNMIKVAFLTCLKLNGKNLALPILTSTFYRNHILPVCEEKFEIKNTSYKKLSKFLQQMEFEGFIQIKEESKGVEKIISVTLDCPEIISFIPHVQSKEDSKTEQNIGQLHLTSMTQLLAVTDETTNLFAHFNIAKGQSIAPEEMKKFVREYLSLNKLYETGTKNIILDSLLKEIVDDDVEGEKIGFSQLLSIIESKMTRSYEMRSQNIRSLGNKPNIQISLANRSGNKKITLVSNLEMYGIRIPEFAKACKIGVAASSTVTRTPGQKADQLLVQGNQVRFIYNLLLQTYKVPPKNISGLELAKKEKKPKK